MKQLKLLKSETNFYGGTFRNKRKGRQGSRPLAVRHSMHVVLRSSQAKGDKSFLKHRKKVRGIIDRFAKRYGVKIHTLANVGNHLHLHIQLANRFTYKAFIRAVTGTIALAMTGASKLKKNAKKFWDYRPFSRVVIGYRAFLKVRDYVLVNQLEGQGHDRDYADIIVREFGPRSSA